MIERGVALGYRKPKKGPGVWVIRRYVRNDDAYTVNNLTTADGRTIFADDHESANGKTVLDFGQAQDEARRNKNQAAGHNGPYTVGDAVADYLLFLESDGRSPFSIYSTRCRACALIIPELGSVRLATLTSDRLRRWRDGVVTTPPRLRTRNGEPQKYRSAKNGEDDVRRRRATANRVWTVLRSALNHAYREGKADTDAAWRRVKPFKGVNAARVRYLEIQEAKRLIAACDPDFRPLVEVALTTGCRYGELIRLQVQDFDRKAGTLHVRKSKSGKDRHIVLIDEGRDLLKGLTAGRPGNDLIFGEKWGPFSQHRPMAAACKRADIKISFHGLRHTWASLSVMNGMPLMVTARNLGHVNSRMCEQHYGHLRPDYIADEVRKNAPKFGFGPSNGSNGPR
jgi:integrase